MFKYAALISYNGTRFCGWQTQRGPADHGEPSIQQTMQAALSEMTGEPVTLVASGRTDSGVHSMGQVAHFVLRQREWDTYILKRGMNSKLKPNIQVIDVQPVKIEFHAQRSAIRKQYSYYFQQGPCPLPHLDPFTWWLHRPLKLEAMQEAVGYLRGEHDFKAFQASGGKPGRSSVRTIFEAEASFEPVSFPGQDMFQGTHRQGSIRIRLVGSGFLKQMVRGIAGTLHQIGEGRRPGSDIREIIESQDRSSVGMTAPARGLWLEKVWYPEELGPRWQNVEFSSRFV